MAELPKDQSGLLVHGRPTVLHFMTTSEFVSSPFAPSVISLANAAFGIALTAYTQKGWLRYPSVQGFASETGETASLFVLRFEQPQPTDAYDGLIATSACKPSSAGWVTTEAWEAMSDEYLRVWIRSGSIAEPMDGVVDWELKFVTTSPSCARQGIAGWMIERAEEEIRRRTGKAIAASSRPSAKQDWDVQGVLREEHHPAGESMRETQRRIRIMASTVSENNRSFYEKRGYKVVGQIHVSAALGGGAKPYNAAHMDKFMDI